MKEIILMKNRSSAIAGYTIPETGVTREFAPGETQKIPKEEIEKLSYLPGGKVLLADYFLIDDKELAADLCPNSLEPEYWMSEENVKDIMLHASIDQFLDCLDYAPLGVLDLMKQYAVSLPLGDLKKIEALKNKTGFDTTLALARVRESAMDGENNTTAKPSARRAPVYEKPAEERRVDYSDKYKVIS